ncbi:unnamed protein product [Clonostachys rosea f. rosea IK726]|uniref:Uncharacterized protein n=1 Tax=Clonostachys rosea f. rosea IK726 TaxID=1349383 RepID=A0ACA9U730_BIOOC|nr:unnamed protein product [Clonostachys rosea f. rosea IK726]
MNSTIKVVVIGCGEWGARLIKEFAELGCLVGVVDEIPARAEKQGQTYGVPAMQWDFVLKDSTINAVAIATPAASHVNLAAQAILAKKHILVEKPMSLAVSDGQRLMRAAATTHKVIMVGHLFHCHPAFIKLRSLVSDGQLGKIRHIYSTRLAFGRIRHVENALWSLAPHDVSMILALLGGESPETVTAESVGYLTPGIVDSVTAHLRFASGAHAQFSVSWAYPFKERKLVVVGDHGMAVFDDMQPWASKLVLFRHKIVWPNGLPEAVKGEGQAVPLVAAQPLAAQCQEFLSCIRENRQPVANIFEGLSVLHVLATVETAMDGNGLLSHQCSQHSPPGLKKVEGALPVTKMKMKALTSSKIHETAVVEAGGTVGEGTQIWHFSHILDGAQIGRDCIIGQNVMVGRGAVIGNRCKIQNNVSIYSGVSLEDGVFCGPSCVFTNVMTPRAEVERKDEFLDTKVRRGATIGANSTVICGVELGEYCMVGAGAVITKSVPPHALVVGNPATQIGWVSRAGERLGPDLICRRTGEKYFELKRPHEACQLTLASKEGQMVSNTLGTTTSGSLPFVDIRSQISTIRKALDQRIGRVLDRGTFIGGPEIDELEMKLAKFSKASHVVTCASGTDAITLSLMALNIQVGDAVFVPTFTFVASVEPVVLLGATPIFLDIEPETFTIDPNLIDQGVKLARSSGYRPVGIIAVDIFGHPADYDALHAAASLHDLWLLADAAQSFGATSPRGKRVGNLATITTTSFFPSKPLGCLGDGGAIFTQDAHVAKTVRSLSRHGRSEDDKFDSLRIGLNSRLDTLQAAVLLVKLEGFKAELLKRREIAAQYTQLLDKSQMLLGNLPPIIPPITRAGFTSAWASYTIRICSKEPSRGHEMDENVSGREAVRDALKQQGFPTMVYYPRLIHTMTPYAKFPVVGNACPVAEQVAREVLSLPMSPGLKVNDQIKLINILTSKGHASHGSDDEEDSISFAHGSHLLSN